MKRPSGRMVISIDLELSWAGSSRATGEHSHHLLDARRAVPILLQLFSDYGVRATWAGVGFLFCRSKDEILENLPSRLPAYQNIRRSTYSRLARIGESEADDPFHYAPSLIDQIAECPGQEVASRTFSNFDCLDEGQDAEDFAADLQAAIKVARRRGIILRSFVFPDNRVRRSYLDICRKMGITAYRGRPRVWPYVMDDDDDSKVGDGIRRLARRLDAVLPVTGSRCVLDEMSAVETPVNVCGTRRLQPLSGRSRWLIPLRRRRIFKELDSAAHNGGIFHLWWRLGDFGRDLDAELDEMRRLLERFAGWRRLQRMESITMHEVVMGRRESAEGQWPGEGRVRSIPSRRD